MRAAAVLLLLVALVPLAAAHAESEAPSMRPDVARVWHEPETPAPHTQWDGFLQLRSGSNVTAANYQVCRVGQACFAPPTLAEGPTNGTFRFDTSGYRANGQAIDYQAGWRLGVKWFLYEMSGNGTNMTSRTVEFPSGPDLSSPECAGDAAMACSEQHYFVFTMGAPAAKPSPGMGLAALCGLLAAAAFARQRR